MGSCAAVYWFEREPEDVFHDSEAADERGSELSKKLGNEMVGLPFTVIVARDGTIHTRHIGAINEAQLKPLLEQLTQS